MKRGIRGVTIATVILVTVIIVWGVLQRGDITYATAVGTVEVSGYLNVRKGPGKKYACVKSGGTKVTLSDNTEVTILGKNKKWYRIRVKYNGKKVKGYVHSKYLTVFNGQVCTEIRGVVSPSAVMVRTQPVKSGSVLKYENAMVKLSKKTKVKILSESLTYGVKYYKISFKYKKKKMTGYVQAKSVVTDFSTAIPGIINTTGRVILRKTAGKTTPVKMYGNPIYLENDTQVLVTKEKTVSGVKYFKVDITMKGVTYRGFVVANMVRFQQVKLEAEVTPSEEPPAPTATPEPTETAMPVQGEEPTESEVLTDSEFKKAMLKEGFPSSYISKLTALHKKYPKWQFKAYHTGLDWSAVIRNETEVGLNLISNSKSSDWKSFEEGAYDWKTDTFIPFDGSTWVTASKKAVEYYMDPRNFMDEKGIFQFESLEYQSDVQNVVGIENVLNNTPMYKTTYTYTDDNGATQSATYAQTFLEAATLSGVSPYHLAARVKQEVVTGPTSMSSSVSGTVSGYEGIYNFYNIGANNSTEAGGAVANGLSWASQADNTYLRPWNNVYKAIVGGAQYIGGNYINVGQNTLYLQKFNVTANNTYGHQYMANVEAPNSESSKTADAYGSQKADMKLVFSIPVYIGMPTAVSPVPSGGSNPNNYLKELSVEGYSFDTPFKAGDDGSNVYTLTVPKRVKTVKILAARVSASATVTGTGTKKLKVGKKTYKIKVKAENGSVRKYKVKITRLAK